MSRTTDRIQEYQDRRAMALHYAEKEHDNAIEARLKRTHGHIATGWPATLIRRTLTRLAIRDSNTGGSVIGGTK